MSKRPDSDTPSPEERRKGKKTRHHKPDDELVGEEAFLDDDDVLDAEDALVDDEVSPEEALAEDELVYPGKPSGKQTRIASSDDADVDDALLDEALVDDADLVDAEEAIADDVDFVDEELDEDSAVDLGAPVESGLSGALLLDSADVADDAVEVVDDDAGSGSRRDPIAEEVESGVGEEATSSRPPSGSFDELLLGEETPSSDEASSAVNLEFVKDLSALDDSGAPPSNDSGLDEFFDDSGEKAAALDEQTVDEGAGEPIGAADDDLLIGDEDVVLDDSGDDLVSPDETVELDDVVDLESPGKARHDVGETEEIDVEDVIDWDDVVDDDDELVDSDALVDEAADDEDLLDEDEEPKKKSRKGKKDKKEKEKKPKKEKKTVEVGPPKYGRRWFGGMLVGTVLVGGGLVGAWALGFEPPADLRTNSTVVDIKSSLGIETTEKKPGKPTPGQLQGQAQQVDAADVLRRMESGDLLASIPENQKDLLNPKDPLHLKARGKHEWLSYLASGKPLSMDVPQVTTAIRFLKMALDMADAPSTVKFEALLQLGGIYEVLGDDALRAAEDAAKNNDPATAKTNRTQAQIQFGNAKDRYLSGLDRAKHQFTQAEQDHFINALARMVARRKLSAADPDLQNLLDKLNARAPERLQPLRLAMLLVTLQPPQGQAGKDQEAGTLFWKALLQANRDLDYSKADELLKEARNLHNKRRYVRLRKAQNPLSDPTEEIFMQTCEELAKYWQVKHRLQTEGFITKTESDPTNAMEKLLADRKAAKDLLNKMNAVLATQGFLNVNQKDPEVALKNLVADRKAKGDVITKLRDPLTSEGFLKKDQKDDETIKALADLVADRKTKIDVIGKLRTPLTTEGFLKKDDGDVVAIKALGDLIKDRNDKIKSRDDDIKGLKTVKTNLETLLGTVTDKLAGTVYVKKNAKPAEMLQGLDKVIDVAKEKDPKGRIVANEEQIQKLQSVLKERRDPEELLSVWITVLKDRTEMKRIREARLDIDRALLESPKDKIVQAEAKTVEGLALRNEGKYVEARKTLAEARAINAPSFRGWKETATQALAELTNPEVYYLPLARELRHQHKYKEALAVTDEALKVLPNRSGGIRALRALVLLDQVQPNDRGMIEESAVAAAKAEAGMAAGKAEGLGHFAMGRIHEKLRQYPAAKASYEDAIKSRPMDDEKKAEFQLSLARVLLQIPSKLGDAQGVTQEDKVQVARSRLEALMNKGVLPTTEELLVLMTLALQEDVPPLLDPNVEEAIKLADQILKRPDIDKFPLLKARAYLIKGQWTDALKSYVDGIRPLVDRDLHQELSDVVERHPRLQIATVQRVANPLQAQRHYQNGLNFYFEDKFVLAEKEFNRAIQRFDLDGRYFYFLGLSQLKQGKQESGRAAIGEGAKLEVNDRPASASVDQALEFIQGPMRQLINKAREDAYSAQQK